MPGKAKRKYVGELMRFEKKLKRPLDLIMETMPPKYANEDLIKAFQEYYPYEWKEICERYEQYKAKDDFLGKCRKKRRYFPLPPRKYFFSLPQVKHILSQGYIEKHYRNYNRDAALLAAENLKNKRQKSIKLRNQKVAEKLNNVQTIEPAFVDALIAAYHKKGNTIDDKMEIFREMGKYECSKTIEFFYKLNDSERNDQIRELAFRYLQETGHYVKLRKKFKGKKKQYMVEKTDFNKTPQDLADELEHSRSIQNRKQFDIFVSHSSLDKSVVRNVIKVFNNMKRLCYCDWMSDNDFLKRSLVSDYTKEVLKKRMRQSKCIVYVSTSNSRTSEWVQWELEYYKSDVKRHIYVIRHDDFDEGKYIPLVHDKENNRYILEN